MCLIVDLKFHQFHSGLPVPLKAEEDILVYKYLIIRYGRYRTYPRAYLIDFRGNKFHYKSRLECHQPFANYIVEKGLHTVVNNDGVPSFESYYAIIPKGSNFYIGKEGDIASDQLIIYKRKPWWFIFKKPISVKDYIKKYIFH